MKYRIKAGKRIRLKTHLVYLLFLILLFSVIYFKPLFRNYQGVLTKTDINLQFWAQEIAEQHPDENWHNSISSGFPIFQKEGIDAFLADLTRKFQSHGSILLFYLLFGGLGIYALFIFFEYPAELAFTAAVLFVFSCFFFSFYTETKLDILKITGILPWIIFFNFYLKQRQSLLATGLLALSLTIAHKNTVPGLSLGILAVSVIFWIYAIVRYLVTGSYRSIFIFSLLFLLAQSAAIASVSYPSYYLFELNNHTVSHLSGISFQHVLLIYGNLILIFIWGRFIGTAINRTEDEDTNLYSYLSISLTIGLLIFAVAMVMRFLFDLDFINLNFIITLAMLLFQGFLLILLNRNFFSRPLFFILFSIITIVCVFMCLQKDLRDIVVSEAALNYEMSFSDDYFSNDPETFRLYPLGKEFSRNQWGKFNQTIGGRYYYSLSRYNQVLQHCLNTELQNRIPLNWNVINMLNVKYLIYQDKISTDNLEYSFYDLQQKLIIYKNLNYMPRAWFVDEVEYLDDASQILKKLNQGDFDPSVTALVETDLKLPVKAENESISLDSLSAEYLELTTRNDSTSFLVISEIYYPGNSSWKAFIDDREVPVYAANYILRGLIVPAGEHKIVMKYQLEELPTLLLINLISLILIFSIILLGVYQYFRKNYKGEIIYVIKQ